MGKAIKNIFAALGIICVIAGIAYVVYKYFFAEDEDAFLDDIDDAFEDDDYFDDALID